MNNTTIEIIRTAPLIIATITFVAMCLWTVHTLEKDNKKNKTIKHKKA